MTFLRRSCVFLAWALALISVLLIAIYGTLIYFIRSGGETSSVIRDGLGRELSLAPAFIQQIFEFADFWPGYLLFFLDTVFIFGLMGIIAGCFKIRNILVYESRNQSEEERRNLGMPAFIILGSGLFIIAFGWYWRWQMQVTSGPIDITLQPTVNAESSKDIFPAEAFHNLRLRWVSKDDRHCAELPPSAHCWLNVNSTYDVEQRLIRHHRELLDTGQLVRLSTLSEDETALIARRLYYFGARSLACESGFKRFDLTFEENLVYGDHTFTERFHTSVCDQDYRREQEAYMRKIAEEVGAEELLSWQLLSNAGSR